MKCQWMEPVECKLVLVLLFPVLPNETSYVALLLNAVVLTLVELHLLAQLLKWMPVDHCRQQLFHMSWYLC